MVVCVWDMCIYVWHVPKKMSILVLFNDQHPKLGLKPRGTRILLAKFNPNIAFYEIMTHLWKTTIWLRKYGQWIPWDIPWDTMSV